MEHILVTGGTGNLGKVVVNKLLESDYQLHLATRESSCILEGNSHYYPTELTSKEQSKRLVDSIVEKVDRIAAGVFIAGGFAPGSLHYTSMDDINNMITLNFATAFNTAVNLIQHFKRSGGGQLIFIGAKAANDNNTAINNMAYSLSKLMLFNFTAMVNECESAFGTVAYILLPRTIDTDLNRRYMPEADFTEWTSPFSVAATIRDIIMGKETNTVIEL